MVPGARLQTTETETETGTGTETETAELLKSSAAPLKNQGGYPTQGHDLPILTLGTDISRPYTTTPAYEGGELCSIVF